MFWLYIIIKHNSEQEYMYYGQIFTLCLHLLLLSLIFLIFISTSIYLFFSFSLHIPAILPSCQCSYFRLHLLFIFIFCFSPFLFLLQIVCLSFLHLLLIQMFGSSSSLAVPIFPSTSSHHHHFYIHPTLLFHLLFIFLFSSSSSPLLIQPFPSPPPPLLSMLIIWSDWVISLPASQVYRSHYLIFLCWGMLCLFPSCQKHPFLKAILRSSNDARKTFLILIASWSSDTCSDVNFYILNTNHIFNFYSGTNTTPNHA